MANVDSSIAKSSVQQLREKIMQDHDDDDDPRATEITKKFATRVLAKLGDSTKNFSEGAFMELLRDDVVGPRPSTLTEEQINRVKKW